MKKIYFLVLSLCFFNGLRAQVVNIPDVNFKNLLLTNSYCAQDMSANYIKVDKNGDGEIQESEAWLVVSLNVDSQGAPEVKMISSLDGIAKFTNLKVLNCRRNKIETIDISGLTKLEQFNCNSNKLTSLKLDGLINLKKLECNYNQFKTLDVNFLKNLEVLDIGSDELTSINLSELTNLQYLWCTGNMFTELDLDGLTNLLGVSCGANQLTSLKLNGLKKLTTLSCESNQFTSLDLSSLTSLKKLYCAYNFKLTNLFIKNGSSEELSWTTLIPSPKLKYICADESDFDGLEAIKGTQDPTTGAMYGYTFYQVGSYCSFTPGGIFYTIKGTAKFDTDSNGCDSKDRAYRNLKFSIANGKISSSLISDNTGAYSIYAQEGTHTLTPVLENTDYFTISPANIKVTFPGNNSSFIQDFCVIPKGIHSDLEVTFIPLEAARPGFNVKYKIIYKNKGNTIQSGSINLKYDDAILHFVSTSGPFLNRTKNNIEWNFIDLYPFESREITLSLKVNKPTDTPPVNNDDILKFTTTILSTDKDDNPLDNSFTLNQTVVGSFDPNDKTCLEGSVITPNLIGEYVHYMIRFENTGTYPAQNIVVKDMIDLSKFDISTLVPTSSSHSFITKISEGNKVEFIFENINLPFDDANNDGYVAFKIKTQPILQVGDSFTNDANIYFDYNFPILTNKATSKFQTTLGTSDFEFSNYFTLYPNPVNDVLNINAVQAIEIQSLAIYDILGQLVIAVPNAKSVSNIDVSKLRTGTYFIKVKSDKGSSNMKFIKK
jgi:hypothetical protein